MKKSQLRQIIKEEITSVLKEREVQSKAVIWSKQLANKTKEFGELLRKKGYEV
jgi:hypothetical protein